MSDMPSSLRAHRASRPHSVHRTYDLMLMVVISLVMAVLLFVLLATPY
jgi:hypothetical protein